MLHRLVVTGFTLAAFALISATIGCSADVHEGGSAPAPLPAAPGEPAGPKPSLPSPAPPPADDPGPAPAGCTGITADEDGFFNRRTAKGGYTAFVPKTYAGRPTMLVVGLHGCGDSAYNFATWGVNPYKTRQTQGYIGISIGGRDGECWDVASDEDKVSAAIADVATCFYVHKQKVVLAGYSSGGVLAYRIGLGGNAGKYAGILIENSALGRTDPARASWKINVGHIAHTDDTSFPISKVRADWAKLEALGIPLSKREVAGGHDGTSDDWTDFLLPLIGAWKAP